jgi:hypothetical protein
LVPTVGPVVSGGKIWAGSAFACISDTVAIGHVLYVGNILSKTECWVSAKETAVHCSVIIFRRIHIFIGETSRSARFAGSISARIAIE